MTPCKPKATLPARRTVANAAAIDPVLVTLDISAFAGRYQMRSHEKPAEVNRGLWCALAFLAVAVPVAGCSRESVPTDPSALGSHSELGHAHGGAVSDESPNVASELAVVRTLTAKYHDVSAALADGYQLGYRGVVTGCISNPTAGAMGYHYFNWAKMDDPAIAEHDPEVLVYHTADDGTLVLGAVEWVVPKTVWEQAGHTEPPVVFGQPLHVINPVLNWYIAHAWIWTHNPSGMFADWNPEVSCP
jgi:hypothetical protein